MSAIRKSYRIIVDDKEYFVKTNARDMAPLDMNLFEKGLLDPKSQMDTIFNACVRLQIPGVPTKRNDFLDLLDEIKDLDEDTGDEDESDPTPPPA